MADQSIIPPYVDSEPAMPVSDVARPATPRSVPRFVEDVRPVEKRRSLVGSLDTYLLLGVGILLAIGMMMVYSTTFDWSYQAYGSESAIFMIHVRNAAIGGVFFLLLALIDYRIWRRFAVWLLLIAIASLVAVLLFGDDTFGARRALIRGSYQPGEMAELIIIIYMAAWMGAKHTKIRSFTYGLIPFATLVGIVGGLVLLQPDFSTAAMIFVTSGIMFFLGGADVFQLTAAGGTAGVLGWMMASRLSYAQERVDTFLSSMGDLTRANYHMQQAIIAFLNGGWVGVGLGESRQKFGFLPAPHTDSIFAVIGEELGIVGAAVVVALYVALVVRGFQVAKRAVDSFGALLAAGISVWVAVKALLNIAVMTGLLPSTGVPLPFISYGGSSLVVLMAGVGLLVSVARVSRQITPGRNAGATHDRGWGNRGTHLSRTGRN